MKKLTSIFLLILVSATMALAQTKDEKEILKFIADYDQSYMNMEIGFMETNLADDYTISGDDGTTKSRAQTIEEAKKEKANPTGKMLSFKSTNENLRVVGNMAVATGSWSWSGTSLGNASGEPHNDKGRYTMVFEKRKGKWLLVTEHYTEAAHDKKLMEAQVLKMGQEYGKMIQRGDAAEIERILAGEYLYTNEKGEVKNKAEDVATYKNPKSKIESAETTDQKVRVVGNNVAIETGTFHVKGTDKDGKPFDETERYTTTWVWRDLRWQIASDHTSIIKK